jgi:pimeloyl-ACP methyl ester carboxylesterase
MEEDIAFTNHLGESLAATLHVPNRPSQSGVILGHCFTCSRHTGVLRQICHGLAEEGFTVLRFDFSGNGQSEGNFSDSTYSKQVAEMKSAAAFLGARRISWIGLAGHSMGAMVALLAAAQMESVKAVCTLASRSSGLTLAHFLSDRQRTELEQTGRLSFASRGRSLELTKEFFADASQYDLRRVVASLHQPLLIVHGDQDEIIPVEDAHFLCQFKPQQTELAIVRGADHMFSKAEHRDQVAKQVVGWFKEQAGTGTEPADRSTR